MKVSICMITYNQENLLAQAIESVMMQETDFGYELVIGEDCSTDGTRQVCISYHEKYPERIRLSLREQNIGMLRNFVQTIEACTGEYVAILEGDDYWTSPHKLQKQVDFLDKHRDYTVCFTRTKCFVQGTSRKPHYIPPDGYGKRTLAIEDLLRDESICTCSTMFRNGLFDAFPDWYFSLGIGDWPLHIMNARHGKVGYIPETMAAYRMHPNSYYSSRKAVDRLLGNVQFLHAINGYLHFEYDSVVREMLSQTYQALSILYFSRMDVVKGARFAFRSVRTLPKVQYLTSVSRRNMAKAITILQRTFSR